LPTGVKENIEESMTVLVGMTVRVGIIGIIGMTVLTVLTVMTVMTMVMMTMP